MGVKVLHGDCRDVLAGMPDCSVDSVVTDPPYEISFMAKTWDGSDIAYDERLWAEVLRVLKPGGHLLAFGGTRTYHRMTCAIEDVGFEIRDSLHWLYGSGFPKSLDVSKAIDKAAGAEREVVGSKVTGRALGGSNWRDGEAGGQEVVPTTAPATDAARQWDGWGTALKPAHEPIVVARKPLVGTVAANVLEHGTGGLNIDGCRVGWSSPTERQEVNARTAPNSRHAPENSDGATGWGAGRVRATDDLTHAAGRWPANLVLTHAAECGEACAEGCPVAELDGQSGVSKSNDPGTTHVQAEGWGHSAERRNHGYAGDTGGASCFFTVTEWDPIADVAPFRYVAKPSKRERNAGVKLCACDKLPPTDETEDQWDNEDHKAAPPEATAPSPPRDTGECGTETPDDTSWSTSQCGRTCTDQSRPDTNCTTGATTNSTTGLRTCNSSTPPNTSESTPAANCGTECGGSLADDVTNGSPSAASTGTCHKKDGRCTDDAAHATSEQLSKRSGSGGCVRCGGVRGGHPTVKPVALMRWLVRLVTPPGGVVLDPFTGSGTTLVAAVLEGHDAIGVEMTDDYLPIIEGRVAWAEGEVANRPDPDPQPSLFEEAES